MSEHGGLPKPNLNERHLPNPTFWSWLKSETALFISQLVTILGIILYVGSFSYYVFGREEPLHAESLNDYLETVKNIVFYSNISVCILFILLLIHTINKNNNETGQVILSLKRMFDSDDKDIEKNLKKAKKGIKNFKYDLIVYWLYAILFYTFIIITKNNPSIIPNNKNADIIYNLANTFGAFILFVGYQILISPEQGNDVIRRKIFITCLFYVLTCIIVYFIWNTRYAFFNLGYEERKIFLNAASGIIYMIPIAMIISRLDSKFIGLPSPLISLIYGYAIIQPLVPLFEDHSGLESVAYFLAFIFKIYFMIIIMYTMQTGRMLNFYCCSWRISKKNYEI